MVRVIVFALIALGWWLAAPDRFTAAARTASGTGLKAAGAGAKVHWNAGRDGRALARTDRRDRWAKRGGWWRKLLGLEHAAVVTGKAARGTGKLAAAAVKPVPGEIRAGWHRGMARHGARTAGRPVPVALDPPWWRQPDPAPVPDETDQDSPQDSGTAGEDSPAGQADDLTPTTAAGHDIPPQFERGDRLVDGNGKPWVVTGVRPQIDADTYDLIDETGAPGCADIPRPDRWQAITEQDEPTDPPAGTDPAGTTTPPTPTDTNGAPMPAPTELRTHVAVQDFAQQIDRLSESSDFVVVAEKAREVGAQSRAGGFGAEMDSAVDELEGTAKRFAQDVDALREQAAAYGKRSLSVQGA